MRRVAGSSEQHVLPFVCDAVEPGARVHTDGSAAYRSLSARGYGHRQSVHLASDDPAHVSMPGVHRIASLLKRWLLGTHQGAVRSEQLDYYLDDSPSGSIAAPRAHGVCCSVGYWNKP